MRDGFADTELECGTGAYWNAGCGKDANAGCGAVRGCGKSEGLVGGGGLSPAKAHCKRSARASFCAMKCCFDLARIRILFLVLLLSVLGGGRVAAQVADSSAARDATRAALVRDVGFLASEKLKGRATGTPGADSAAVYLASAYYNMQVDAFLKTTTCDQSGACTRTYYPPFRVPERALAAALLPPRTRSLNVIATVPGTDSSLKGQWIVIGAHYDHLGTTGYGAMDRATAREPHLGADDNASGTAAVLELALRLANAPLRRPVLLVHFGGEELGVIGSRLFVEQSPVPLDSVTAMFNFDMVGRLQSRPLQLWGLASSRDWKRIADSANVTPPLKLERHDEAGPENTGSDHDSFLQQGVPVMHFFTGLHAEYHTTLDVAEKVDYDGMVRVIDYAERVIRLVGDGVPLARVRPKL